MERHPIYRVPVITQDTECSFTEPYGYVYLTINRITGKKYVGKHRSEGPVKDYKYIGSGRIIKKAIDKYGLENFENWILQWASSPKELNTLEMFWITEFNAVDSPGFYNIYSGGEGASSADMLGEKNHRYGTHVPLEIREQRKRKMMSNPDWVKHHQEQLKALNEANAKSGQVRSMIQGNILTYYQYSLNFEFIHEYHGINELRKCGFTGYVSDCCKGKQPFSSGFVWSFISPEKFSKTVYLSGLTDKALQRYNKLVANPRFYQNYVNKYKDTSKFTPGTFR